VTSAIAHSRAAAPVLLAGLATSLVAGCSVGVGGQGGTADVPAGVDTGGHVHELALDGADLLLATHLGLWRHIPDTEPLQVTAPPFDVMSLALDDGRLLASGHPHYGGDDPVDLGLRESVDGGRRWREIALGGEVDFHALAAAGDTVLGVVAADGSLARSTDGGLTWTVARDGPIRDVAVDPDQPSGAAAIVGSGLDRSDDAGATWFSLPAPPDLAQLAWTSGALYGLDGAGFVHRSPDGGRTWEHRAGVGAPGDALAADGNRVAVLADGMVYESTDAAITFLPRLSLR
jgi:photosystem II stability/assembly factor-like uncharacterized protein